MAPKKGKSTISVSERYYYYVGVFVLIILGLHLFPILYGEAITYPDTFIMALNASLALVVTFVTFGTVNKVTIV